MFDFILYDMKIFIIFSVAGGIPQQVGKTGSSPTLLSPSAVLLSILQSAASQLDIKILPKLRPALHIRHSQHGLSESHQNAARGVVDVCDELVARIRPL